MRIRTYANFSAQISARCGALNEAEQKLVECIFHEGELQFPKSAFLNQKVHRAASTAAAHRTIRASLLRCLIMDKELRDLIPAFGIRLHGAWIVGPLDLCSASIGFPLVLADSYIPGGIELRDANTVLLSLKGSHTGPITASRIVVNSSLGMNDGFWSEGPVHLHGASIKGVFDCRSARFHPRNRDGAPPSHPAHTPTESEREPTTPLYPTCMRELPEGKDDGDRVLMAEDITVQSDVYLSGVETMGCASLSGAVISDSLELVRDGELTRFINPGGVALNLDRVSVGGNVLMGDRGQSGTNAQKQFRVEGTVSLVHAHIRGSLHCGSTQIHRDGQVALDAREAHIDGSVYFEDGFETNGMVRLTGSEIGACLYFNRATFFGTGRTGLIAKRATIRGTLAWTAITTSPLVQLDLRDASAAQFEDDDRSWPGPGNLLLDGFVYEKLITRLPIPVSRIGGRRQRRRTRIDWLHRQLSHRFSMDDLCDFGMLAQLVVAGGHPIAHRFYDLLIDDDSVRIQSKVRSALSEIDLGDLLLDDNRVRIQSNISRALSEIDKGHLLLTINLLLNDRSLPSLDPSLALCYRGETNPIAINALLLQCVFSGAFRKHAEPFLGYFRPQPYEQLASFLLDEGDKKESVHVLIAKEDARRKHSGRRIGWRLWRLFLKWTTAYGYKPYWTGSYALVLVFVGAIVFGVARQNAYMVPAREYLYIQQAGSANDQRDTQETPKQETLPPEYPEFNELIYSADVFFPIVDLHQQSYWLPGDEHRNWRHKDPFGKPILRQTPAAYGWLIDKMSKCAFPPWVFHIWLLIEIAAGWVLSTLFFAGFFGFLHTSELHEKSKHRKSDH